MVSISPGWCYQPRLRPAGTNAHPLVPVGAVAKMASHAIFQYNVLAIDDTHNTWTNIIVKMTILRLLGSSDDKERIGVARPEGTPLVGLRAAPRKLFGPKIRGLKRP